MKLFAALVLCAVSAKCVLACECSTQSVESGLKTADLVFGAEVVSAVVKGKVVEIGIDVAIPIKGEVAGLRILKTKSSASACGYVVSVPQRYVFFTRKDGTFDACGATRLLSSEELGPLSTKVIRKLNGMED